MTSSGRPTIATRSPLWMITNEPQLNGLVTALAKLRSDIITEPDRSYVLIFTPAQLEEVRAAFARTLLRGEQRLHRFCALLGEQLFASSFRLQSVVIGQVASSRERFTLIQDLSFEELTSHTDLDLGTRQLQRLRYRDGDTFSPAELVANFVDYQPLRPNAAGVHKITSRIKAEEELWNKVVDEIFHIDELVERDKELRHLSRYVKDVFGLKLVVGDVAQARALQQQLESIVFGVAALERLDVAPVDMCVRPTFIEVKDYLTPKKRKRSGWLALKSVVRWWETTLEIQIQPLEVYLRERENLTQESHASFKVRRESLRDEIAKQIPLFGFYRDLLKWLFMDNTGAPPGFARVEVRLEG